MKTALTLYKPKKGTALTTQVIGSILDAFIAGQDVKQSSKQLYRRTLNLFFTWIIKKGLTLDTVNRPAVIGYKEELLQSGMSSLTVSSYLTTVRRFYEWAESNGLGTNVAKGIRSPRRKQQFKKQPLATSQAVELLEHCQIQDFRDYAIISTLLRTGIREIELVRANVEDITFKTGKRILLIHGKGRDEKDNFVILTDKAYKPIADYLKTRGNVKASEPLFICDSNRNKAGRLTTRSISRIAKNALKAIGIDSRNITGHSLRHTAAVSILRAGGSLEEVQGVLRHANPATTQIYTETIKEEMRLTRATEEILDSVY